MTPSARRGSLSALENRLFTYLDSNLKEIKDSINAQRGESRDLDRRIDSLSKQVGLVEQRLEGVEKAVASEEKDRRARPVQTWQVVVGAFAILSVVWSMCQGGLFVVFQLVNLYLSYLHK